MSGAASRGRVLVAEDGPTRLGIRLALNKVAVVCAEAASADAAIAAAGRCLPDLCLIGLTIPGGGMRAAHGIVSTLPRSKVLMIADSPNPDDLVACLRAGATGYLPKATGAPALRRAVTAALGGETIVPRAMVGEVVRELRGIAGSSLGLSAREAQVLAMLRRGNHTATIAHGLNISPVTVRRHISSIMRKMGARDRAELIDAPARSTA